MILKDQIVKCKRLESCVEKASYAHVSRLDKNVLDSIFGKRSFHKKIIKELYHELDPFNLVFLKSDVKKTITNYSNYPFFGLCLNFPMIREELAEKLSDFKAKLNQVDYDDLVGEIKKEKPYLKKERYESKKELQNYLNKVIRFGYD